MRVVALIQARMGSSRLPGKVLQEICGESMLAHVVHRTQRIHGIAEVVVATSDQGGDSAVVAECKRLNVQVFCGSEEDVLDRFYQAALRHEAQAVLRITSDCPLLDPAVATRVVQLFLQQRPDYASNTLNRTYPRGLDAEAMTQEALACAWREATEVYQRAHVTPYLYEHPDRFRLLGVTAEADFSSHRWTVDTPEDLEFVRALYKRLGNDSFRWQEALKVLEGEPSLSKLNRHIQQKPLEQC